MNAAQPEPEPLTVLFARGVISRLAIWETLRIAVQESWGGHGAYEKRRWFASAIIDTFEEQTVTPDGDYIEEMLLQVMADEFEAVLEDDSAKSVANDIVCLWKETRSGKEELVKKFEIMAEKYKGRRVNVKEVLESDDEDWEDEDEDEESEEAPTLLSPSPRAKLEPQVDDDGFTLVQGKGRERR